MFPSAKNIAQFCFFPKPNLGGIVSYPFGSFPKPQISDLAVLAAYPFGSILGSVSKGEYRYGMNTQEKDSEIYGEGNSYTAEYWQYDARLGRRWNVDPKPNPSVSVYACFRNNPIIFIDPQGDTTLISWHKPESQTIIEVVNEGLINEEKNDGVFIISAHGNPRLMLDWSSGKMEEIKTADDFYNNLMKTGEFKKAMEEGKRITIILKSCNTGTDPEAFGKENKGKESIAQIISGSDKFKDMVIIAPDGYVNNKFTKVIKYKNGDKKYTKTKFDINKPIGSISDGETLTDGNGGWVTFKNGKKVGYENSKESELTKEKPIKNQKKIKMNEEKNKPNSN